MRASERAVNSRGTGESVDDELGSRCHDGYDVNNGEQHPFFFSAPGAAAAAAGVRTCLYPFKCATLITPPNSRGVADGLMQAVRPRQGHQQASRKAAEPAFVP